MVHFDDVDDDEQQEEEKYDHLDYDDEEQELELEEFDEDDDDDDADEENLSSSRAVRILKRKVFNEIPHDPNYIPYSIKIRESGILDFKFAFTKLCEDIRNLVDIESFWCGLDGFNDQLSQLKEMGYNVVKVSKRIDLLKGIAERERASRAAAEKFESEVRDREAKVSDLRTCISYLQAEIEEYKDMVSDLRTSISDLQAEIEESKHVIADRKSKIETLKKDSNDAVAEFISIAKQNLNG